MNIDLEEATASDFLVTLPIVKHRLAQLGLWKTAKALDGAIHAIGFEVGEIRQKDRSVGATTTSDRGLKSRKASR